MSGVGAALDKSGVKKLIFIRHANAAPPGGKKKGEYNGIHDWQKDDQVRLHIMRVGRKFRILAPINLSKYCGHGRVPVYPQRVHVLLVAAYWLRRNILPSSR